MNEINILLVEDNPGDIELVREAFSEAKIPSIINIARDGDEALDYLHKRGNFLNSIRLDIMLMDLNMPKKNGKEILAIIKNDDELKDIPVIVLTSSEAPSDVIKSYKLHANAYVVKPTDFREFVEIVSMVESFWMKAAKLPKRYKQAT